MANGAVNSLLKKNIIGSFLVKGVGIAVNLALIPIGIHFLDKEHFGVWVVINSLLTWLTFFDLGLGNGMRNKLTTSVYKKRIKEARQLVGTGYITIFYVIATIFLVFLLVNSYIRWNIVFNVSASWNGELTTVIFWAITLFLVQILLKNIGFILLSLHLTAVNNSLMVFSNILSLVVIYSLSFFNIQGSLLTYALIICGTPVVIYLLATVIFFSSRFSFLRPTTLRINKGLLKDIGGLGLKFFVIQAAAMVLFQGNNILITQYFGPEEVTNYNVSYRYFNIVIMIFSILLTPFWSIFTKAYAEGNTAWIRSTLIKLQKMWFISIGVILVMIIMASYVYRIWVGSHINISMALNIANGLFAIIYAWNSIYLYFLNGVGKIRLQYLLTIIVLLLYVPLVMLSLTFLKDPALIIFVNCATQLLFSVFCYIQVQKILNKKAYGIWDK
jgi:O-antigen/teichoic acid export membrane protein